MRSLLVIAAAAAAIGSLNLSASAQCTTGGAGGAVPAAGTGGGALAGQLPPTPFVSTLNVTSLPAGATSVTEVKLNGFTHTWASDITVVLTDPAGVSVVLLEEPGGVPGYQCNFNGDYSIVDAQNPAAIFPACPVDADIPAGAYEQYFGTWPAAGFAGVQKVLMSQIPPQIGTWTLTIYDWVAADAGALTSWDLCFGTPSTNSAQAACNGGTTLSTIFTGPNGGAINGQIFFNLTVNNPAGINVSQLEINSTYSNNPFELEVFTKNTPFALNDNTDQSLWTSRGIGVGYTVAVDQPTVVEIPDFTLAAGNYSVALVIRGNNFRYTNGTTPLPGNQVYSNADITITGVGAQNVAWVTPLFSPRVFNGSVRYNCGPAIPPIVTYCTAGTTTNGCNASLASSAQPSATNATSPVFTASNVEGAKQGLMFYGLNNTGFTPLPWSAGSSSFLCVKSPTQRFPNQTATGTANQCNGVMTQNFVAWETANPTAIGQPFAAGQKMFVQAWFRDPPAPKTTNLSNAIELTFLP